MATDNPNKKKADAKRISQQPHEQTYQTRKKKAAKSSTSLKNQSPVNHEMGNGGH